MFLVVSSALTSTFTVCETPHANIFTNYTLIKIQERCELHSFEAICSKWVETCKKKRKKKPKTFVYPSLLLRMKIGTLVNLHISARPNVCGAFLERFPSVAPFGSGLLCENQTKYSLSPQRNAQRL